MPFAQLQFLETQSQFFYLTVLSAVFLVQIILGVLMPGTARRAPYMWWFAQRLISVLQLKLDRPNRSKRALYIRGALSITFLIIVAISVNRFGEIISETVPYGWAIVPVLLWGCFNIVTPWRMMRFMMRLKTLAELKKHADVMSNLTGLTFKSKDSHALARAVVLYAGYSFVRFCVGPALFFGFFGLSGVLVYVFVTSGTYDMRFGAKPQRAFLKPAYLLQMVLDVIPARLAAVYIYLSSILTPTAHPKYCLEVVFDHTQRFSGANFSSLFKAFAGAVGASLGGGFSYQNGDKMTLPWIGHKTASAKIGLAEIKRAFVLYVFACVFLFLTFLLLLV